MSFTPIAALSIMFITWSFMGLLFGGELAAQSFPEFRDVGFSGCTTDDKEVRIFGWRVPILSDVGGAVGYIGCIFGQIWNLVYNLFAFMVGAAIFVWQLITFNVPGAPTYVRAPISGIFSAIAIWATASLFGWVE